jgi:antitoxin (DNA-binding transcriptional repressor) of toxin-antitoxin stability system
MKIIDIDQTTLNDCVGGAQSERIVITRGGKPVALVVGVDGLDEEQLELGSSDAFWKLIEARRQQRTLTREQLEKELQGN